jgi:16S rRNA processing protein RimM
VGHPWRPARVRVGTVGRPHGVHGAFHVSGPCGWWDFPAGSTLLLDGDERRIEWVAGEIERPIVRLAGVEGRDAASALTGSVLELPGEAVPEPEEDSWFRFDLVGCEVFAGARRLGRVASVEDGVAHDILLLDDATGTRIPFVAELVPGVDVPGRRLDVAEWLGEAAGE